MEFNLLYARAGSFSKAGYRRTLLPGAVLLFLLAAAALGWAQEIKDDLLTSGWAEKLIGAVVAGDEDYDLSKVPVIFGGSLSFPGAENSRDGSFGKRYTVEDLYAQVVKNNRELMALKADRSKAVLDVKGAKARRFPTINLQTSLTHIANPAESMTMLAGELGNFNIGPQELLLPEEDTTLLEAGEQMMYEFKLTVDQPVFAWGKISNNIVLHERAAQVRGLELERMVREMRKELLIYMYALFYLQKISAALRMQGEVSDRLIEIATVSYENGFILYTDLLTARIAAKEIEIAGHRLSEQRKQMLLRVEALTGLDSLSDEQLDFSAFHTTLETLGLEDKNHLHQKALRENVNIRLLEQLQSVSRLKLKLARGSSYLKPDIGLHLELSYSGSRFPFLETDWNDKDRGNLTSSLVISTTVFDGLQIYTDIKKAQKDLERVVYEYERGLESIAQYLTGTLLALELNRQNLAYYRLRAENDEQQIIIKRTQFETGIGNESDYLKAQLSLYSDIIAYYNESVEFWRNLLTVKSIVNDL